MIKTLFLNKFCMLSQKNNINVYPTIASVIYVDFFVTWLLSLLHPYFLILKHNHSRCFSILFFNFKKKKTLLHYDIVSKPFMVWELQKKESNTSNLFKSHVAADNLVDLILWMLIESV